MFFYASKIIWFVLRPSNFAFFALLFGLLALARGGSTRRLGVALCAVGVTLFGVAGYSPAANILLSHLEHRFPAVHPSDLKDRVDGIIILGGFEDFESGTDHHGLPVNEAAERLTEGLRLARRHPKAKIMFTGAVVDGLDTSQSLAGPVGKFLEQMGVSPDRILLEPRARNTYENAVLAKALAEPAANARWVLITSGYHMPRSVGAFRAVNFDIIPYPVDLRTHLEGSSFRGFTSLSDGLKRFDLVVREYIGLVGYWLTGKTSDLFPAPDEMALAESR
ncbi:MAG: YdcF family protein [Pseudomonadota bacterium]